MEPVKKLNPALATLIVIAFLAIIATIVVVANQSNDQSASTTEQSNQSQQTNQTQPATEASPSSASAATYNDGTYTETGNYFSPGGRESIEVTVTLKEDVITDATVVSKATDRESRQYQQEFISGYKNMVVGKKVDEVSLSRVAGSSLTSNGFNTALDVIKTDAKA